MSQAHSAFYPHGRLIVHNSASYPPTHGSLHTTCCPTSFPPVSHSYALRPCAHNSELLGRLSHLVDCNFITRMLFCQSRPRGRPKRIWREVVREDCQASKLNKEMDRYKWRKVIKDVRSSGWVWVGECFFWYRPTRVVPDKRPLNGCCCRVLRIWNSLPKDVVSAAHLSLFISRLVWVNLNQFLIGKM